MAEYAGVDVQHPRIKEYVENLTKMGKKREEIVKIVGVPHEVVESIQTRLKNQK